jgi:hypothetical protein
MGGPERVLIATGDRRVNSQYLPRAGGHDTAAGPGRLDSPRLAARASGPGKPKSRDAPGRAVAASVRRMR